MKRNSMMIKRMLIGLAGVVVLLAGYGIIISPQAGIKNSNGTLEIVAAENFWGSLISQIGGTHVHVTSLVNDPNADPHEFSSSATTARAVATANYVVVNGAGYDSWADKLINGSHNDSRKVLTVADLLNKKNGDNPHFWYNPAYVDQVTAKMTQDLSALDPANADYYKEQYRKLQADLAVYQDQIEKVKQEYVGTKVAATEDIFDYLARAAGLTLVSPSAFTQAVAEGNDPPTDSIVQFQQQLKSGAVKVLVFNQQTETPLTDAMKKLANDNHIPIVGITETTQPASAQFQDWMNVEIIALQDALKQ